MSSLTLVRCAVCSCVGAAKSRDIPGPISSKSVSVEPPWKFWYVPNGPPVLVCSAECGATLPRIPPKTKRPAGRPVDPANPHATQLLDRPLTRAAILLDQFERVLDLARIAGVETRTVAVGVLRKRLDTATDAVERPMVEALLSLLARENDLEADVEEKHPQPCQTDPFSSRACERGTKSCVVHHTPDTGAK